MTINALLVCDPRESQWIARLNIAFGELAKILPISAKQATEIIKTENYSIIIVDEAGVEDVPIIIRRLKFIRPNAQIVVAAELPTWQEARAAFQAGAVDFIQSSMKPKELLAIFNDVISASK